MCIMLFSLAGCHSEEPEDQGQIVATAFGKHLYQTDISSLFGEGMSRQDSFLVAKGFIDNWIQRQVILHFAEKSELNQSEDINKKTAEFREDLLSFSYLEQVLSQKIDTSITTKESREYYESHPENFELKQNIIKLVFIKMPAAIEKKPQYWKTFSKADDESISQLAILALKNGGNAFLDGDKWLAFDDILKVVPINTYNQENFIHNNRLFRMDNANFVWYVKILDFRIKDQVSPFDFVKEKIHQILLNKRKTEMIRKIRNEMVLKAYGDNQVKIFIPKYE